MPINDMFDGEIKKFDSIQFESWGIQAADGYIRNGVLLNDSIKKIAQDNSLNPKQISRVVETANNAAYLGLFKQAKDKTFEFPLADTKEIVKGLNIKVERENPDVPSVYLQAPTPATDKTATVISQTFIDFLSLGDISKKASAAKPREEILKKIAHARMDLEASREVYVSALFKIDTLRKQAHRMIEEILLSKKASAPELVDAFAEIIPDHKMTGIQLLQDVVDRVKKTAAAVPDTLFERKPGVRVINGAHPLFGLVKTIDMEENKGSQKLVLGEMFEENIRELKKQLVAVKDSE